MRFASGRIMFGASVIAIASSAFAAPAFAQDDVGVEASEIVVTARRKDERLQDVPLTVNAVAAEDLSKLNIKRFEDVTALVPGLVLRPNDNGISGAASVRGVNYEGNASGNNGTIEFYRNDAPTSVGALFGAMYDVGQIELLRGPQGTLRGRASPSGSMTVTTHRVNLSEIGGYVTGTATDIGGINANGALNIPIINDVLAVRVAAIVEENEGNRVRSLSNGIKPYMRSTGGRISVRFEPTSNLSFNYVYDKLNQKFAQFNQVETDRTALGVAVANTITGVAGPLISASDRLAVADTPMTTRQQFDSHTWNAEWAFAGQKLVYVGGRLRQKMDAFEPEDKGNAYTGINFEGTGYSVDMNPLAQTYFGLPTYPTRISGVTYPAFANPNFGQSAVGGFELNGLGRTTHTYAQQTSHELLLQSEEPLFGKLDYVVGGFLSNLNSPSDMVITTANFNVAPTAGNLTGTPLPSCLNISSIYCPGGASAGTGIPAGTLAGMGVPPGFMVTIYPRRSRTAEKSLYGNLTLHVGEATEISGGARYIYFEDMNLAAPINPVGNADGHANAVIYSFSAKHRFSENLMVYASTGSSWRPGINVAGVGNYADPSFIPSGNELLFRILPPEKSKSYEIGFKSALFNRKVRLNVALFHQDYKNFVYRAGGQGVAYYDLNRGSVSASNFIAAVPAKVNGAEVEISSQITRNWSMGANFSYALAKIKNGVIPCNAATALSSTNIVNSCTTNQRAGTMAPFSGNFQTEYFRSVSAGTDAYIRGLVNFTGQSQGDPQYNNDQVKAYALVNLYAGIRDPKGAWDVSVYAKNLTNLNMVTSRDSLGYSATWLVNNGFGPAFNGVGGSGRNASGYRGVNTTRPREFGVTMRYAFGSR